MELTENTALQEICRALRKQRLPRWQELPDLDLYMDQVLALVGRYLNAESGFPGKGLTASMVNNYVKLGIMPAPVKKRYDRTHLAYIIIICVLKTVLPISSVQQLIASALAAQDEETLYNSFCALFEDSREEMAQRHLASEETPAMHLCRAALRAQAEQALALRLEEALAE